MGTMTKRYLSMTVLTISLLFSFCVYSHAKTYQQNRSVPLGTSVFESNDEGSWLVGIIFLGVIFYVLYRCRRYMNPNYGDGVKELFSENSNEGLNRDESPIKNHYKHDQDCYRLNEYDHEGYDRNGYNYLGYNKDGFAKDGSSCEGFDQKGQNPSKICDMCGISVVEAEMKKLLALRYCPACASKARS